MTEHTDTLTTNEMCALLTIDERALHRLLHHVETTFQFRFRRIGTRQINTLIFSRDEAELLQRVHHFSQRLDKYKGKYVVAAVAVLHEMKREGTLDRFETTVQRLHRLRTEVATLEQLLAASPSPAGMAAE